MKQIPLTQGKFAIVDDEDYEWLNQWKWYARKHRNTFYAIRNTNQQSSERKHVRMHRLILGLRKGDGKTSDHKNGNGLDNRRKNLRICTKSQNSQNRLPLKNTSSKFKGVYWDKKGKIWRAGIQKNSKRIYLGCFKSEIEAAKAYDRKAKELFGEFALCNLMPKIT